MSLPPSDADDDCPTFRELKTRLIEYGCKEVRHPLLGGLGDTAPTERFMLNPQTGLEVPCEHWVEGEFVTASICSHVCRRLGIPEQAIKFEARTGPVQVKSPTSPPGDSN